MGSEALQIIRFHFTSNFNIRSCVYEASLTQRAIRKPHGITQDVCLRCFSFLKSWLVKQMEVHLYYPDTSQNHIQPRDDTNGLWKRPIDRMAVILNSTSLIITKGRARIRSYCRKGPSSNYLYTLISRRRQIIPLDTHLAFAEDRAPDNIATAPHRSFFASTHFILNASLACLALRYLQTSGPSRGEAPERPT